MERSMGTIVWIGMGGFVGAVLRYLLSGYIQNITKVTGFPYGTLTVNLVGSFIIGLIFYYFESNVSIDPQTRSFVLVGVLGAFTTFSTFSIETLDLLQGGQLIRALINMGAHGLLGLLAVWSGRAIPVLISKQ